MHASYCRTICPHRCNMLLHKRHGGHLDALLCHPCTRNPYRQASHVADGHHGAPSSQGNASYFCHGRTPPYYARPHQQQHKPTLNMPLELGFSSAPMPTSPSPPPAAPPPPSPPAEGLRCSRFPPASSCPSLPLSAVPTPLAAPPFARTPLYPALRPLLEPEGSRSRSRPVSRSRSLCLRRSRSSTLIEGTPAKDWAEAFDVRPSDADSKAFSLRKSSARCRSFWWGVGV